MALPFYDDINKQNRYKAQCEDYVHNEYLIVNGCKLLPFQIKGRFQQSTSININEIVLILVNVDTAVETDLTSHLNAADWDVTTAGQNDYITYYAANDILNGGNCVYDNCVYYLKIYDIVFS